MSAAPIDYDALAKQAGAVSSAPASGDVDYDALAKQAGAVSSQPTTAPPPAAAKPGILDTVSNKLEKVSNQPLTSHTAATEAGLANVGQGVVQAVKGAADTFKPAEDGTEKTVHALLGPGGLAAYRLGKGLISSAKSGADVPVAISDINASPDPLGTYANVAAKTAGQAGGQAVAALATEGAVKAGGAVSKAVRPAIDTLRGKNIEAATAAGDQAVASTQATHDVGVGQSALDARLDTTAADQVAKVKETTAAHDARVASTKNVHDVGVGQAELEARHAAADAAAEEGSAANTKAAAVAKAQQTVDQAAQEETTARTTATSAAEQAHPSVLSNNVMSTLRKTADREGFSIKTAAPREAVPELASQFKSRASSVYRTIDNAVGGELQPVLDGIEEAKQGIKANAAVAPDVADKLRKALVKLEDTKVEVVQKAAANGVPDAQQAIAMADKDWSRFRGFEAMGKQVKTASGEIRTGGLPDPSKLASALDRLNDSGQLQRNMNPADVAELKQHSSQALARTAQAKSTATASKSALSSLSKAQAELEKANSASYGSEGLAKVLSGAQKELEAAKNTRGSAVQGAENARSTAIQRAEAEQATAVKKAEAAHVSALQSAQEARDVAVKKAQTARDMAIENAKTSTRKARWKVVKVGAGAVGLVYGNKLLGALSGKGNQ